MPVTLLGVEIVRTWGAPFEAQGKAVLRPYIALLTVRVERSLWACWDHREHEG